MYSLKLKIAGEGPMLMHSDRSANPLDPEAQAHKQLTNQKKKTEELQRQILRSEWNLGMYFDDKLGPYVPTANFRKSLIEAGRINKFGKDLERAVVMQDERAKLEYRGPRTKDELWDAGYYDIRSVRVTGRVMRCRPLFNDWWCAIALFADEELISEADLLRCAEKAGRLIGLGDNRVNGFGRFGVQVLA